jgi:putative hydrolase of the HAD superfamily
MYASIAGGVIPGIVYDPSMKIVAVLFDAAETLFTTRGSVGEIYGDVARQFGSTTPSSEIQAAFVRQFRHSGPLAREDEKQWWKDVVFRVFSDVGMVRDFDRFFEAVYNKFRDSQGWALFPETREVLEGLKARGLKLGVISNFDSRVYSVMRSLEILQFFDAVTISSEAGYAKPHPEIFKTALRMLQVQGSRTVLVGDSLDDDVEAAKLVGIHSVLLDRTGRHPEFDSAPKIQNLRQVFDYIHE